MKRKIHSKHNFIDKSDDEVDEQNNSKKIRVEFCVNVIVRRRGR